MVCTIWATSWQNQQNECVPSEDSTDKLIQISLGIRSVWSVFAVRMKKPWVLSYPLSTQQRLIRLCGCLIWVFVEHTGHFVGLVVLWLRFGNIYFQGILSGMQKNLHNKHVQISGSASLFYLVKGDQKHRITQKQRRYLCLISLERKWTGSWQRLFIPYDEASAWPSG